MAKTITLINVPLDQLIAVIEDNAPGADTDEIKRELSELSKKHGAKKRATKTKRLDYACSDNFTYSQCASYAVIAADACRDHVIVTHREKFRCDNNIAFTFLSRFENRQKWDGKYDPGILVLPAFIAHGLQAIHVADLETSDSPFASHARKLSQDVAYLVEAYNLGPEEALMYLFFDFFHLFLGKNTWKPLSARSNVGNGGRGPKEKTILMAFYFARMIRNRDGTPCEVCRSELLAIWNRECRQLGKHKWVYQPTEKNPNRLNEFWRDCKKSLECVRGSKTTYSISYK